MSKQRYHTTRKPTPQTLTERELQQACRAWDSGGNLGLGAWACKVLNPWDARAYGELVDVVRDELNDYTDYS